MFFDNYKDIGKIASSKVINAQGHNLRPYVESFIIKKIYSFKNSDFA